MGGRLLVNTHGRRPDDSRIAAAMQPQTYVPAFTLEPLKREVETRPPDRPATPNFINDIAGGRVELPTIPRVLQKLIAALRDPDVDARQISDSLSKDPVLSAKVLRLANSSFFGGQRSMASIDAAVALIGTQALNRLIVACGVASSFREVQGIDLPTFWRDAVIAGTAAGKLASRLGADPESAYVCGLLHATGHLILCQTYPDVAGFMFGGYETARGPALAAIENECFGTDHPIVGALWVDTLGFPQDVPETIRKAAQPSAFSDTPLDLSLRGGCSLAASVAGGHDAAAAFAALSPALHAAFGDADGKPGAAFEKMYELLRETDPAV